ncbi:MAG TPA: small metal-binding protein SmbP [Nitrospira sp.]|nr:small metal-binding protein SmbP [Nitrospira sp.]
MIHAHCMKAVMGGLSLVLMLSACSSGAKSRKAEANARSNSDVVADRGGAYDRGTSYDPTDRMTPPEQASTERAVPVDRLGTGDGRLSWDMTPEDRIVPCADATGDMTASMECDRLNRERADRMGLSDRSPEIAKACPSRTDAQGNIVFNDPACPNRYRRTVSDSVIAACSSRRDAKGKLVYDDPACPARHRRQMGSSYENVRWTQESAFYDRYADKAVKHARQAEVASYQGHIPEMLQHAELSLDQAKEAQRAGRHPDLDAGISALRDTIILGEGNHVVGATSSIREARIRLSRAAGIPVREVRPANDLARPVNQQTIGSTHTIKGQLARKDSSTRIGGGEEYVVRDTQNHEMPIALSPEMSRQVQVGDVVEAQIDPNGQVTSISKAQ